MRKVLKSDGRIEKFNYKKLQKSLEETFRIVKSPDGQSQDFIKKTLLEFAQWQKNKPEITSSDIRIHISKILEKVHPEASYIYKNFKNMV